MRKNDSSARTIPIHSKLKKIIEELVDLSDDEDGDMYEALSGDVYEFLEEKFGN